MFYKLLRGVVLKILYPLLMLVASFMKGKKERFQRLIIDMNNSLVKKYRYGTKKILLLLPHCIQVNDCEIRLTHNIYNCKRCGKCGVKDLISVAEEHKLNLFIATGGTLARKIVMEARPEAIVAVACERDLSSGVVDTYPLPVLGIPNERPFGPCFNTRVDMARVRDAIEFFSRE